MFVEQSSFSLRINSTGRVSMKKKSILIVDDHMAVRIGLRSILSKLTQYELLPDADSGETAYELYTKFSPDIVITDISMPGIGGVETIRRICAKDKRPYVIAYTLHAETIHARRAIEAGAKAYILKSGKLDELVVALSKASSNNIYLSEEIAQKFALDSISGKRTLGEILSTREYEVLCYLSTGMKVNEIASLLDISAKTVATYQTSLKNKLNINNAIDLAMVAIEAGIIEPPKVVNI